MAVWKKVLTETHTDAHPVPTNRDTRNQVAGSYQASGTYNTIIGTDTDLALGTTEHIAAISVTDGVITSMSKQTLSIGDLSGTTAATQATALGLKAPKASPSFTGTASFPASGVEIDGDVAITVESTIAVGKGGTGATATTGTGNNVLSASPTFTGTPSLPTGTTAVTQSVGNSSTRLATTAFVAGATSAGDLTSIVAGAGLTGSSLTGPIPTLTLDLTELSDGNTLVGSEDKLVILDDEVQKVIQVEDVNLGAFNNDQSWTSNTGTTTASNSQTLTNKSIAHTQITGESWVTSSGVTSVGVTAPVATSGGATPTISMAAATASANGYLTSTNWSTFNNKGSSNLALGESISTAYRGDRGKIGYDHTTVTGGVHAVGTVTSVSAGTAIDITEGNTVTPKINVDLSELVTHTIGTGAGTITIAGNLTVTGTTTTVNTEEIKLADNNILINAGNAGAGADGGITIDRGSENDVKLHWNEAKSQWFAQCLSDASGTGRVMLQQYSTAAPTSSNDGCGLGQFWLNKTTNDLYIRTS